MSGQQTGIVSTNLPSFPWVPGQKLDAVPLNNEFFAIHNLIDNLQNQITTLQATAGNGNRPVSVTASWGGGTVVTPGNYVLTSAAPFEFFITSVDFSVGNSGGSFLVSVFNNNVAVNGLQNIQVNSPNKTEITVDPNDPSSHVMRGVILKLVISDVQGVPTEAFVTLNGVTVIQPTPEIGVGVGLANGTSSCLAVGVSVRQGEMIMEGGGTSSCQAQGMSVSEGVGKAVGTSTAIAQGVQVLPNHVFVMDDPMFGVLDTNPLG